MESLLWRIKFCYNIRMSREEEDEDQIEEIYELTRKNNDLLRKMYFAQRRSAILGLLHWVIIIVMAVIAYIYIEPYIEGLEDLYTAAQQASENAQEALERLNR